MKKALCLLLLLAGPVRAAPPVSDPDWPCVQRFVPTLSAESYWNGPPPAGDWRADPRIAAVVAAAAPRTVPQEEASGKVRAFAAELTGSDRAARMATLFAGLVDETNGQRDQVIGRLRALTRRQREITRIVESISTPGPDADPAVRDEAAQRRAFLVREFEETERTIRYACEVPVQLEARLGAFGRMLDSAP